MCKCIFRIFIIMVMFFFIPKIAYSTAVMSASYDTSNCTGTGVQRACSFTGYINWTATDSDGIGECFFTQCYITPGVWYKGLFYPKGSSSFYFGAAGTKMPWKEASLLFEQAQGRFVSINDFDYPGKTGVCFTMRMVPVQENNVATVSSNIPGISCVDFKVPTVSCAITSALDMNFGTMVSARLNGAERTENIAINCTAAATVNIVVTGPNPSNITTGLAVTLNINNSGSDSVVKIDSKNLQVNIPVRGVLSSTTSDGVTAGKYSKAIVLATTYI